MSSVDVIEPRRRSPRSGTRAAFLALAGVALAVTVTGCAGGGGAAPTPAPPLTQPAAPAPLTKADVDAWLDGLLPTALTQARIAGAAVSVVHDGKVVTARGYGYADTGTGTGRSSESGQPVEVDPARTLFRPASISKAVTATAVLRLVEQGKLDLDADITPHLDFELPLRYDTDLTLRHLLTHTAGFEERLSGMIATEENAIGLRESLVTDPPEQIYEPGTTPAYSNYGNALAGYLVERVSGEPFEEYVKREVLDRIGMASSSFRQPLPPELRDRLSNGYRTSDGLAQPFEMVGQSPAGALSAPATDMAQFMLAHLGALPAERTPLSRQTLDLMHSPALTESTLGGLAAGERMTLGFFTEDRNGRRILGHGGDTDYFHSHLQIYPDDQAGIFVTFNSSGPTETETIGLRESVLSGFADRYFPGPEAPGSVDEQTRKNHAEAMAGTYQSSRGFQSTFLTAVGLLSSTSVSVLDDGRLLFAPGPGSPSPAVYEEVSPWVFREVGGHRVLAARVANGEVTAIGHDSAFTLLPVGPAHAVGLPVLVGSALVLLLTVLAWPAGALLRRRHGRPAQQLPGRAVRLASRIATVSALLALAGWVLVFASVLNLQDVPVAALRSIQVLQLIGVAGLIPAVGRLVSDVRHRTGWLRTIAGVLVILALAGTVWFAVEFQLLAPSISY